MAQPKSPIHQLKNVWSRVGLDAVPAPEETKGTLRQRRGRPKTSDRTAQLNLRIRPDEKERINAIALRQKLALNEVFSRMLEFYERTCRSGRDDQE